MRLEGKIAIVTGAAQGIGRGIADRFVKEGALVAMIDYKSAAAGLLDRQRFYQGDVSDAQLWKRVVSELLDAHGRIDVLVNNAAIVQYEAVHEVKLESWNRALAVNLTGVMLGMRAVIPGMLAQGGGSIINLSSIWGSVAAPGAASYHASKAGVGHLPLRGGPANRKTLRPALSTWPAMKRRSSPVRSCASTVAILRNDSHIGSGQRFVLRGEGDHADGAAQTPGERPRDRPIEFVSSLGVAGQHVGHPCRVEHEEIDVFDRDRRRSGWPDIHEQPFAERLSCSEEHRGCLSALVEDAHGPVADDVQGVVRVPHRDDRLTGRDRDLLRGPSHDLQDRLRDILEHDDLLERSNRVHGDSSPAGTDA
jgi:hypothetical protein